MQKEFLRLKLGKPEEIRRIQGDLSHGGRRPHFEPKSLKSAIEEKRKEALQKAEPFLEMKMGVSGECGKFMDKEGCKSSKDLLKCRTCGERVSAAALEHKCFSPKTAMVSLILDIIDPERDKSGELDEIVMKSYLSLFVTDTSDLNRIWHSLSERAVDGMINREEFFTYILKEELLKEELRRLGEELETMKMRELQERAVELSVDRMAFFLFMKEERPRILEENRDAKRSEVAKLGGERWRALSEEQRAKWRASRAKKQDKPAVIKLIIEEDLRRRAKAAALPHWMIEAAIDGAGDPTDALINLIVGVESETATSGAGIKEIEVTLAIFEAIAEKINVLQLKMLKEKMTISSLERIQTKKTGPQRAQVAAAEEALRRAGVELNRLVPPKTPGLREVEGERVFFWAFKKFISPLIKEKMSQISDDPNLHEDVKRMILTIGENEFSSSSYAWTTMDLLEARALDLNVKEEKLKAMCAARRLKARGKGDALLEMMVEAAKKKDDINSHCGIFCEECGGTGTITSPMAEQPETCKSCLWVFLPPAYQDGLKHIWMRRFAGSEEEAARVAAEQQADQQAERLADEEARAFFAGPEAARAAAEKDEATLLATDEERARQKKAAMEYRSARYIQSRYRGRLARQEMKKAEEQAEAQAERQRQEEKISAAANLLSDPATDRVRLTTKMKYLRKQGLTQEEVEQAIARSSVPPSPAAAAEAEELPSPVSTSPGAPSLPGLDESIDEAPSEEAQAEAQAREKAAAEAKAAAEKAAREKAAARKASAERVAREQAEYISQMPRRRQISPQEREEARDASIDQIRDMMEKVDEAALQRLKVSELRERARAAGVER